MILNGAQIIRLAEEIETQSSLPNLTMQADLVDIRLPNIAPGLGLKESAIKLLTTLNSQIPPKVDQFLEILTKGNNARLRTMAAELLTPTYYSPTGSAHDAILIGKSAFVARDDLRKVLQEFTYWTPATTRVLIVRGEEPGGKSYSWQFLRHLAAAFGFYAVRLRLKGTSYQPRELFEQVYLLLGLDPATIPELKDDPQLARIDSYINAFKGKLIALTKRYWLVIDDINDPSVTPAIRDTVYQIAYSVEDLKSENLWVALIGYNVPIADPDLKYVAVDEAEFPSPAMVARHFAWISDHSPVPLTSNRAREIADLLFSKYPKLDKEAMIQLTTLFESMGEKLQKGLQP